MFLYNEIKEKQPILFECFFAFSNEQFVEGKVKAGIVDQKIYSGIGGLYGTKEGIKKLYDDHDAINAEVAEKCDPQEVYAYEFGNHECGYTYDDSEAFAIIEGIFGEERAKAVKRKFAYSHE
jgi:hypothetical protein